MIKFVRGQVEKRVWEATRDQTSNRVWDQVQVHVRGRVEDLVLIRTQVYLQVERQVRLD